MSALDLPMKYLSTLPFKASGSLSYVSSPASCSDMH
eukprot:CAMPEP_0181501152 /NCGR_PEP_ID=MMETSP1110-20121109/55636_1 /TAXON_ID=174948 /ORGANISM="Symbiodinium sp., Strain CCMP421" /LENGTH=35 /DNA_ID= /DNA_START= /DNA_END= /DNA_ORIENTATION=